MLAFKNLAKSTLGELKGALVEADDDEDEEDVDEEDGADAQEPCQESPNGRSAPPVEPPRAGIAQRTDTAGAATAAASGWRARSATPERVAPGAAAPAQSAAASDGAALAAPVRSELPLPPPSAKEDAEEAPALPSAAEILAELGGAAEGDDRPGLLASLGERYDAVLAERCALQARLRDAQRWEQAARRLEEEVAAWQVAHRAATARVEELTLRNADLSARACELEKKGDAAEKRRLMERLAAREAEARAATDALQKLQNVLEDADDAANLRALERQLREVRQVAASAEEARAAEAASAQAARDAAAAAVAQQQPLATRCGFLERELRETTAALEVLLQEKSRHLDEREHYVDRRLVTSMLALYLDHLGSGQRGLADQVLKQTMQVLGADSAQEERQRIKEAAAAAQARLAEPLGDAFVDFLTREATPTNGTANAAALGAGL